MRPVPSAHRHSSAPRRCNVRRARRSPTRAAQRFILRSTTENGSAASHGSKREAGLALRSPKGEAGFTLAELIAVVTIIAILAAAVVGGIIFAQKRAAIAATKGLLGRLSVAINEYRNDYGAYPPDWKPVGGWGGWDPKPDNEINTPAETLWYFLAGMYEGISDTDREKLAHKTAYLNFQERDLKRVGIFSWKPAKENETWILDPSDEPDGLSSSDEFPEIVDAWGMPIYYVYKGSYRDIEPRVNPDSFDLISRGADRLIGNKGSSRGYNDRDVLINGQYPNRDNIIQ